MQKQSQIPCQECGLPTEMLATKLCDNCWEINHRIQRLGPLKFDCEVHAKDWARVNMRGFSGWYVDELPEGGYGIRIREGGPFVELFVKK